MIMSKHLNQCVGKVAVGSTTRRREAAVLLSPALALVCAACGGRATDVGYDNEAVDQHSEALGRWWRPRPVAHALTGWAALDHSVRQPGPTSGQFLESGPYAGQPVPGYSGLLDNGDGTFLALPDNGFGSKANSADYVLGFYNIAPHFKTTSDGTTNPGAIENHSFTAFSDPNGILNNGVGIDLLVTADFDSYRSGSGHGTSSGIPVDPAIKENRLLTGYDFDVESIARDADGTYWVGEEFGPYLLHFDTNGTLIDEPVPHPVLASPHNPVVLASPGTHTLAASRGFESLSFDHAREYLYPVPESAPVVDALRPVPGDERVLEFYQFDPRTVEYTGVTYKYRKDGEPTDNGIVIGDMTSVGPDKFVLIERDNFGLDAEIKRLYIVDLNVTDADGILKKNLVLDLLDIDDPRDIGGPLVGLDADKFNFPFVSVECVLPLGPKTLGVAIDTNFPATGSDPEVPASTEFISVGFSRPVASLAPRN